MANFYRNFNVQTVIVVGQDDDYNPATTAFAKTYQTKYQYNSPMKVVVDPSFKQIGKAAYHWTGGGPGIPHFIVLDYQMKIYQTDSGLVDAAGKLAEITGETFEFPE